MSEPENGKPAGVERQTIELEKKRIELKIKEPEFKEASIETRIIEAAEEIDRKAQLQLVDDTDASTVEAVSTDAAEIAKIKIAANSDGKSTAEDTGDEMPALPNLRIGGLTAAVSLLAFLLIPSEFAAVLGNFNTFTSVSFITGMLFFALHLVWFKISQKQLLKHTQKYLSEINHNAAARSTLLTALPAAWMAIIVIFFSQFLFASSFPIMAAMPWLVLISALYFVGSMFYWPGKLKALCQPAQKANFPRKFSTVFLSPLMTLPYIWYWRRALEAVEGKPTEKKLVQPEVKQINRDKMVIRYRPFIAIERWYTHRHKSTTKAERSRNAAIAVSINIALVAAVVYYLPQFPGLIAALFTAANSDVTTGAAAGNIFVLSNQAFLALIAALTAAISAVIAYIVMKQPTHYEFTPLGFRSFRWMGAQKVEGEVVPWKSLSSIQLNQRNKKGQVTASEIQFNKSDGEPVKLNLRAVESVEDREVILNAIERWAPGVSREASVVQALQPPVDHSYTELWLQALSAPPQRDRLKPLTEDVVVGDGRYKVKRSLGVGGQGAAYAAYDLASGETVVLKEFLLPIYVDMSVRKDVLESFESEARILKHLNHEQVVKLENFFVEDHRAYLVLEHIDGKSLREIVAKEGPLSEERVRQLSKQMCTILTYLHSQEPQVVHRDFTPENLILRNDGILKLIDFNVARQVESNATGSVVGKPAYLPPEQFRGQPVSQSDIYGMGATLSFLLTGKEPEPISVSRPRKFNKSVSRNLDDIVARATAINLKDRYANCHEIIADLQTPYVNDSDVAEDKDDTNLPPAPPASRSQEQESAELAGSAGENLETPNQPEQQAERKVENQNSEDFTAIKFKTAADTVNLKIVESAQRVDNGKLAVIDNVDLNSPQKTAAGTRPDTSRPETSKLAPVQYKSAAKANQPALANNYGPLSLSALIAQAAALVSWLVITIAIAWTLIPGSQGWLDPQASLHQHTKQAIELLIKCKGEQAYAECEKCIAIDPTYALGYYGRGTSLISMHRHDKTFTPAILEQAIPDFARAATLAPNDYFFQQNYGHHLTEAGQYKQAIPVLTRALQMPTSAVVPQFIQSLTPSRKIALSQINVDLAKCQLHLLQFEKAKALFESAEATGIGAFAEDCPYEMVAYEFAGEPEKALEAINYYADDARQPGQQVWPVNAHRAALTRSIKEQQRDKDAATKTAMKNFYQGLALNGIGKYSLALDKFDAAIALKPNYPDFHVFRAVSYRNLKRYDMAMIDLQTALQLNPNNVYAAYLKGQTFENAKGKGAPGKMVWDQKE